MLQNTGKSRQIDDYSSLDLKTRYYSYIVSCPIAYA